MVDSTGHDDLSALDFSTGGGVESDSESDALDFSVADDGDSTGDALGEYVPAEPEEMGTELDALAEEVDEEEDPLERFTFTVTNPPGTVSVSAIIGGRIHQVELSPKVTSMDESQLADEILVIAQLAGQKAKAGQHTYLMESDFLNEGIEELGVDGKTIHDFMQVGMGVPTPDEAEAAQAEVFATRYAGDND